MITVKKWNKRGQIRWVVRFRENGKPKHRFFTGRDAANSEAARLRGQVAKTGTVWNSLTSDERDAVIASWRDGQKKAPASRAPALSVVITDLIAAKKSAGRAKPYTTNLKQVLEQFAKGRETLPIDGVGLAEVESFLNSKSLVSRSTLRSRLSTLFKYAVRRGYRLDDPCQRLEKITVSRPPPAILTVDQVKACLEWLSSEHERTLAVKSARNGKPVAYQIRVNRDFRYLLPWFVLTTFCGMRPEEAEKTTKADINTKEGWIKVEAQTTKVRQRRIIEPKACALALLASVLRFDGLPLAPMSRKRAVRRLRAALGLSKWPKDVTRHSAASYWLSDCKSAGTVAENLGHSEKTLKRHYAGIVTREQAAAFWALADAWAIRLKEKTAVRKNTNCHK